MIAVSIYHRRPDLLAIQRDHFKKHLDVDLRVAAWPDSEISAPDVALAYGRWRFWPEIFLDGVGQVIEAVGPAEDLLIVEGDVWPVQDPSPNLWPALVCREWGGLPYPGLMYRRAGRDVYPFWLHLAEGREKSLGRIKADLLMPWRPSPPRILSGEKVVGGELIGGDFCEGLWFHLKG